ncbi:hypothetical protein IFR04_012225 [Cadophora malorum]|uniref:Uncharacterized protein n=1 Tax=Cadophora malorum TaxID=108018 RepID=A0A8H7T3N4_9HELO|nr:hypothetical protein IFR04_012225 [Cadophora malorum]
MSNQGYYNQGPPQQPPNAYGGYQQGGYAPQYPPQQGGYQQGPPMQQHLHLSKREAHAVEVVSVSVWPHCAVAVSAKKVARRALIVPSAVKDAAKNGNYDTTPTTLRARKYTLLRSNKAL